MKHKIAYFNKTTNMVYLHLDLLQEILKKETLLLVCIEENEMEIAIPPNGHYVDIVVFKRKEK